MCNTSQINTINNNIQVVFTAVCPFCCLPTASKISVKALEGKSAMLLGQRYLKNIKQAIMAKN